MKVLITGTTPTNKYELSQLPYMERTNLGRFKRIRTEWSLDNFNDGYIDNRRRFRIWFPHHPRAYKEGYILRSIVAYEAYHNTIIPEGMDVHHLDGNQLNDSKENLQLLSHGKHSIVSNKGKVVASRLERTCQHCGKTFIIKKGRLSDATHKGKYCSQKCYQSHPKSEESKMKRSKSLKKVWSEKKAN